MAVPGEVGPEAEPDATVKDGVMKATFAKAPKAKPKKITVKKGK